jgi:ribose 5-phosphate isomerase B
MKVAIGSDHAGFELKNKIKEFLADSGHDVLDQGTFTPESYDYPDAAKKVARAIQRGEAERGVLVCGTGIGMSIAANKFKGIRAAVCHNVETAVLSREHNDANILALSGRGADHTQGLEIVEAWMKTEFLGGRHARRVDKMMQFEQESE